jgi:hypothetical protein
MSDRAEVVYENWASVWNTYKNTDKVAPLKNSIRKTFYSTNPPITQSASSTAC